MSAADKNDTAHSSQNEKNTDISATKATTKEVDSGVVDKRFISHRPLTRQEEDAALNCVMGSKHNNLTILPNHSINTEGELEGFCFRCHEADSAAMLPLSKSSFATTAIYECSPSIDSITPYLQLVTNIEQSAELLQSVIADLQHSTLPPLTLACMPDWENIQLHDVRDQREWIEGVPDKLGLYHCFMRSNAQNMREHKVFIVISGHCVHATEELHNLWLDACHTISAKEFMQCAEVAWLRQATLRHHNRLAARVAHRLKLNVRFMTDMSAVGPPVDMLLPTMASVFRDLHLQDHTVFVSNNATLFAANKSGVIFDCWATEGFWVFMGPRDTSSYKIFGTDFKRNPASFAFPTSTVRFNTQYQTRERTCFVPVEEHKKANTRHSTTDHTQMCLYARLCRKFTGFMFPHSAFVDELQKLGFSLNDGITNLMPIVTYCTDE